MRTGTVEFPLRNQEEIECGLAALYAFNVAWLERNPNAPHLYNAGVTYRPEPPGRRERWLTYPELLQTLSGDCEDLASGIAAWLTVRDRINALPVVVRYPGSWHIVVAVNTGSSAITIDPSKRLGMEY